MLCSLIKGHSFLILFVSIYFFNICMFYGFKQFYKYLFNIESIKTNKVNNEIFFNLYIVLSSFIKWRSILTFFVSIYFFLYVCFMVLIMFNTIQTIL